MGIYTEFLTDVAGILLHPQTAIYNVEARNLETEVPELAEYADRDMAVYVHFTAPFVSDFQSEDFDGKPVPPRSLRELRLIGALVNSRTHSVKYEILSRTDTEVEIHALFVAPRNPDWGFFNPGGKWPKDMTEEEKENHHAVIKQHYGMSQFDPVSRKFQQCTL